MPIQAASAIGIAVTIEAFMPHQVELLASDGFSYSIVLWMRYSEACLLFA